MTVGQFEQLFEQHYASICARIARIVVDSELAEDLVQDAFVKFWETKPLLLNEQAAPAYIARMAINNALMQLRKTRHEREFSEIPTTEPQLAHSADEFLKVEDINRLLNLALERLPSACRQVFVLSRYEGMSYKEIAGELNISVKTVENQIGYALKFLKSVLLSFFLCAGKLFLFFL